MKPQERQARGTVIFPAVILMEKCRSILAFFVNPPSSSCQKRLDFPGGTVSKAWIFRSYCIGVIRLEDQTRYPLCWCHPSAQSRAPAGGVSAFRWRTCQARRMDRVVRIAVLVNRLRTPRVTTVHLNNSALPDQVLFRQNVLRLVSF
jgi:hypothetical protein